MKRLLPLFVAFLGSTTACTSGGTASTGGPVIEVDGGVLPVPDTAACTGDTTRCLSGTAQTQSLPTPQGYLASLYAMFPAPGVAPVSQQAVARDGTWAFSNLSAAARDYVQIVAVFGEAPDGGGGTSIPATVGPLAVPSSGPPLAVVIRPVQLSVVESSRSGGPLELQSALAYVFDPSTGAPSAGNASVSILVGETPVAMPWTAIGPQQYAYYAAFTTATPAQATYTITTSASASWQLVAAAPTFTPSLTAPASGATVPSATDLVVSWTPQAAADGELVYLYDNPVGGVWTPASPSPTPLAPTTTQETIPGSDVLPGQLLVDTAFLVGSCPASSDGCVVTEAIASAQITAQ